MEQAYVEGRDAGYQKGYGEGLATLPISSKTEDEVEDAIPVHNITNPIVREYFASLPVGGYSQTDISRMRYFAWYNTGSAEKNMADRGNPYVVYADGDALTLECPGEPTQTILPRTQRFECYLLLPGKTYSWRVTKSGKVVKQGKFKTVGDIRLIQIPTFPNMRDIAYPPMKFDRVLSAANPDNVVVGSDDYNTIKALAIDTEINLRTPKAGSNTEKPWRSDIFTYGYDIDIAAYAPAITKPTGWKKVIETLIKELELGHKVVFNCYAGADRTGTLRYILQGFCGVPRHIAHGFYELTSLMFWENFKRYDDESDGGGLRKFDRLLATKFGSDLDFQSQCYRFLNEIVKLSESQLTTLRRLLCD